MKIVLNGKQLELHEHGTISDLLQHINVVSFSGIALAVNDCVIVKSEWNSLRLRESDKITLIKATQGG